MTFSGMQSSYSTPVSRLRRWKRSASPRSYCFSSFCHVKTERYCRFTLTRRNEFSMFELKKWAGTRPLPSSTYQPIPKPSTASSTRLSTSQSAILE